MSFCLIRQLFVEGEGSSDTIDSVTACYEFRSYGVILDPDDCLFLTSNSKVAIVDGEGLVTAVKVGTADIVVSYKGETDTLEVTVSAVPAPKPIEIIVDMPTFEVDEQKVFTMKTVANDDVGKTALAYFTLPEEAEVWYWEVATVPLPSWQLLPVGEEVGFGDTEVPLGDITFYFKAKFNEVGTYPILIEVWTVTGIKPIETKVELLCFEVITIEVEPAIPDPPPDS
ncbi:hypothetical protein ES708_06924 [subsurface metagenome]